MRPSFVRTLLLTIALLPALAGVRSPAAPRQDRLLGDSALSYARQQVAFGPRVPGTPQAQKAGDWIVAMMKARADTVIEQRWTHATVDGKKLPLRNILARFKPDRPRSGSSTSRTGTRGRSPTPIPCSATAARRSSAPTTARRASGCSSRSATRSRRRRPTSASICCSSTARTTARASTRRTRTSYSARSISPSICRAQTTTRSSASCGT